MDFGPELTAYKNDTIGVYGGKFYPLHKGHIACILQAQSQVDTLFVILQYDETHERDLIKNTHFQHIPPQVRLRWLTEELKDFPNIRVFSEYEPRSENYMEDTRLTEIYANLNQKLGGIDKVFSNDPTYTKYFNKYLPDAEHVVLFGGKKAVNISATQIRENFNKNWDFLPKTVKAWYTKRVAICGIESAGKSHITKMLTKKYDTLLVPEYGRLYYENLNGFTGIDMSQDYDDIVAGQIHSLNLTHKEANRILFADTDLIYTQYFHIRQHGYKNMFVEEAIKNNSERIDHRIYIMPHNFYDLDGTRVPVTSTQRWKDNQQLLKLYESYGKHLHIVDEKERTLRFDKSVSYVDKLLTSEF